LYEKFFPLEFAFTIDKLKRLIDSIHLLSIAWLVLKINLNITVIFNLIFILVNSNFILREQKCVPSNSNFDFIIEEILKFRVYF
jgi:hypothetical protein